MNWKKLKIGTKLKVIEWFSSEDVLVCGADIENYVLGQAETLWGKIKCRKERVPVPIYLGKKWIKSDFIQKDQIVPITQYLEKLDKERNRLEKFKDIEIEEVKKRI